MEYRCPQKIVQKRMPIFAPIIVRDGCCDKLQARPGIVDKQADTSWKRLESKCDRPALRADAGIPVPICLGTKKMTFCGRNVEVTQAVAAKCTVGWSICRNRVSFQYITFGIKNIDGWARPAEFPSCRRNDVTVLVQAHSVYTSMFTKVVQHGASSQAAILL